jgi:hypothetical protein
VSGTGSIFQELACLLLSSLNLKKNVFKTEKTRYATSCWKLKKADFQRKNGIFY